MNDKATKTRRSFKQRVPRSRIFASLSDPREKTTLTKNAEAAITIV